VQLFNTKIKNIPPSSKTRFTLLHSSRTPGELPPPELLNPLSTFAKEQPERFKFHVFVDGDDGSKTTSNTPPLNIGRINENALQKYAIDVDLPVSWWRHFFGKTQPKNDLSKRRIIFLVCGPEAYVSIFTTNSAVNVNFP
jgi:cytochrome-b5 reductase